MPHPPARPPATAARWPDGCRRVVAIPIDDDDLRADLARRIYASAHLTGTFTLRSGRVSQEYFDKYRFEALAGEGLTLHSVMARVDLDAAGG